MKRIRYNLKKIRYFLACLLAVASIAFIANKMKKILLILSIIALFSCSNNKKPELSAAGLHISKEISNSGFMQQVSYEPTKINATNSIDLDSSINDKVSKIKYIYLKTEEPIGYANKVIIHKSKIFVIDVFSSQSIFIFDMEGNLINIISDKGGGPQEYISLIDVNINDDTIIVADGRSLKRLYYTLDGKYIRHEKCLPCRRFASFGDKFILHLAYGQSFDEKETPNLVVSIKDSAMLKALPYHNIQKKNAGGEFNYNYKDDLLFTPGLSDTVYQILTDFAYAAKYVVEHKKSIWQLYNEELQLVEMVQRVRNGYTRLASKFYETEKNAYFEISVKDPNSNGTISKSYWYDKKTEQTYTSKTLSKGQEFQGKDILYDIIPRVIGVYGNSYIGVIHPETIISIREQVHQQKIRHIENEELRKIIDIKDDPNQAIVLFEIDFNK
jgi:hypothetical protein